MNFFINSMLYNPRSVIDVQIKIGPIFLAESAPQWYTWPLRGPFRLSRLGLLEYPDLALWGVKRGLSFQRVLHYVQIKIRPFPNTGP